MPEKFNKCYDEEDLWPIFDCLVFQKTDYFYKVVKMKILINNENPDSTCLEFITTPILEITTKLLSETLNISIYVYVSFPFL